MGKVRYFERIIDEDYFDIHKRIKNNLTVAGCVNFKEIEMICDVTICKYNSFNGQPKYWYDCLFNKKASNRGTLEFEKVVDEIGAAKRDDQGRPVLVCEKFIKRLG